MKLLAKAALFPGQTDARKPLNTDGIEPLLLARDFYDDTTFNPEKAAATEQKLLAVARDSAFGTMALEMADSVGKYGIQPVSDDLETRSFSRDLLSRLVDMTNRINAASGGKVGYLQYQLIFKPFDENGNAPKQNRAQLLAELGDYHAMLQRTSDVPLQIENGIRVNPAFSIGTPTESIITVLAEDNKVMGIPLALDTSHYAQTLDSYADARHVRDDIYTITAPSKRKPEGEAFYFKLTDAEALLAARIRANSSRKDAITSELERVLRSYTPIIGSLQFADAEDNHTYGVNEAGAGYNGEKGLIDIPRIVKTAVEVDVPFIIPEYRETDYIAVPHQRAAVALVRSLQGK